MNQKLCKRLRREAEFTSKFQSATQYETKYHLKEVMVLNKDGTGEPKRVRKPQVTVAACTRLVYLQLKKEHRV